MNKFCGEMAVLDGGLLALNLESLRKRAPEFLDEQFSEAGCLMEEYFSHQVARAGFKVGIHQNLGVLVDWRIPLAEKYTGDGRLRIAELMDFEPLLFEDEDRAVISTPVGTLGEALVAQMRFLDWHYLK